MLKKIILILCVCIGFGCGEVEEHTEVLTADAPGAPSLQCPPDLYQSRHNMRWIEGTNGDAHGRIGDNDIDLPAIGHRTPEFRVPFTGFHIDIHEVTVGEFRMFNPSREFAEVGAGKIESDWTALPAQVTYAEAEAYARWVGKRLPTEIEWEWAARSGLSHDKMYAWESNRMSMATPFMLRVGRKTYMANEAAVALGDGQIINGKWETGFVGGLHNAKRDQFTVMPVMAYAPSPAGLFDMIGNVDEWCSDDYNENAYLLMMAGIEWDPHPHNYKVVRGGGVLHCSLVVYKDQVKDTLPHNQRTYLNATVNVAERQGRDPNSLAGFRCVLDLE